MFLGGRKQAVIENIRAAVQDEDFFRKVELDDPNLTEAQKEELIQRFLRNRNTPLYWFKNLAARCITSTVSRTVNRETEYIGLENLRGITGGAIITSNHFNPLDSTTIRGALKKAGHRRLYIVSEETNYAMTGLVGFLMNYMDTIPIWRSNNRYLAGTFRELIRELMEKKQLLLIYPEQEMWFNYRKPRPLKRGAYLYAAENRVPVISCFVEIRDCPETRENDEFVKTRYVLHILPTIYPDPQLSPRENSYRMMEQDRLQKRQAYEEAYGKPLDNTFDRSDIAGYQPEA